MRHRRNNRLHLAQSISKFGQVVKLTDNRIGLLLANMGHHFACRGEGGNLIPEFSKERLKIAITA
ncbi:hypothetical protein D5085_15615 [Ectothiorhodospiraceae bacterium BW-2]|nr:hypothetical protein D5085_15615 [Ectothiorhodospiraceae bacterium BW-2]